MATTNPRLQTIASGWEVPDNPAIIVDLIKNSGLLQSGLVAKSTHGNTHKFKYHNELPVGAFRGIGEGTIPTKVSLNHAKVDLFVLEALIQYDWMEIKNYPGGKAGWLRDNYGAYLAGIGNAAATQMFYGTTSFGSQKGFVGFHQYAKALGNVVAQKGGASGLSTSIFASRWDENDGASIRVNGTAPLINTVETTSDDKPKSVVLNTTTMEQLIAYEWVVNAFMTLVVPSKKSVAAITQIDSTHKPTVDDMNKLVNAIYSPTGTKAIYCNLDGLAYIEALKDAKLNMFTESKDYDTSVGFWKGVPIIVDENIVSTESNVLD